MVFRYADPAMDAEEIYQHISANRRMFELENFKGECPYCKKAMFDGAWGIDENCVYDERIDDYAHEICRDRAAEEEEGSLDDIMGNPVEALDNLFKSIWVSA